MHASVQEELYDIRFIDMIYKQRRIYSRLFIFTSTSFVFTSVSIIVGPV